MAPETLIYEQRGHAGWITLNRPHAMNAFNGDLNRRLLAALQHALDDADVFCVVLIGEGGRAFSAGADLKELAQFDARGEPADAPPGAGMGGSQVFAALASYPKPLIAAIDGYCLAGGMEIAALCDIRIATEQSTFGLPEAHLSLMPDPGLIELGRLMPLGEALKLQLTARPMTAQRAFDIGYVQALLPARTALLDAAEQIAGDIARGAPLAVEAIKQTVKIGRNMTPGQASHLRTALWERLQETEDRLEGPRAFAEKRAPVWKRR